MSEIGEILDRGRRGLDFFAAFLPLAEVLAPLRADLPTLAERFDAERRLSLESIRACRRHVLTTREALADSLRVQFDIGESLDGLPGSAELVIGAQSGARLLEQLDSVAAALTDAIEVVAGVVTTKASRIAALESDEIDGRTPEETEVAVEAARRQELDAVTWTENVFLPTMDSRIDRFLNACDDGQSEIEDCFARLADALEQTDKPATEAVLLPEAGPR